mgnify:CR=1 FL=1
MSMKTILTYIDNFTKEQSSCGDPLSIEESSRDLNWDGIIIEKGWSPHFYPNNIITPYFYFAMEINAVLKWQVEKKGIMDEITTLPGEIWMNPPNVPFTHEIDEPCHFIILAIKKDVLYYSFSKTIPDNIQFLKTYNVNDNYLKNMIEMFYYEVQSKGKNGIPFLENLTQMFSSYYIQNYSNYFDLLNKKISNSKITQSQIDLLKDFILSNMAENVTIEELAAECNMSKFYFLKEFKKSTEMTPYQFIIQLKMEKAKEYVINGAELVQIAYDLGFNDQSHFSNTFKRFHGKSPGQF